MARAPVQNRVTSFLGGGSLGGAGRLPPVIGLLIALTFVFSSYWVGLGSTLIVLFISLIEILVAAIQAYVFTLFSALYIGMATAEHEHH